MQLTRKQDAANLPGKASPMTMTVRGMRLLELTRGFLATLLPAGPGAVTSAKPAVGRLCHAFHNYVRVLTLEGLMCWAISIISAHVSLRVIVLVIIIIIVDFIIITTDHLIVAVILSADKIEHVLQTSWHRSIHACNLKDRAAPSLQHPLTG